MIGELIKHVGRSADTIKRWEQLGLLMPERDARGHRRYAEADVERCRRLAELGFIAQVRNKKLVSLALPDSGQLAFEFGEAKSSAA